MNAFQTAEPFPHLVLDDFAPAGLLAEVHRSFDAVPAGAWHTYDGPDERGKRACNRSEFFLPPAADLLRWLTSAGVCRLLEQLTGLDRLTADPELYGGGLHATAPGGYLHPHLDCERHPSTDDERRLNLILYVTPGWHEDWGGDLELWPRSLAGPAVSIPPLFGRAVVFACGPWSYHASSLVTGPLERRSVACYYWGPHRARARFVRTAHEGWDAEIEAARQSRSAFRSVHQSSHAAAPTIPTHAG